MKKNKKKLTEEEKMERSRKVDKAVHKILSIGGLGLIGWVIYSTIHDYRAFDKMLNQSMEKSVRETADHFGYDYTISYDENGKMLVDYYEQSN